MTAERWSQIKQLFDEASEQPPADRESFVRERAHGDCELCEEALTMLRNSDDAGGLLDISEFGGQWIGPAALARTLSPGQVLAGRYRIVRPIGAGGMGEVYEAEDLELGARVAVKTMRVGAGDMRARFKREIQLARTVTHPNVCRIFDLHRHHESESGRAITFLTMELVEGETLSEYLSRRGALTAGEALPIIRQIAAALAAAHDKNVVHRDLKAGNVILTNDGARAVVTDFGLAYPVALATESTVTIAGTPAYMAPEQFEGKPVTAAADIYAFGVLLYEMVVGRRPFTGDSPIALALNKIRTPAPEATDAVPSLPSVWSAVIQRCLQPDPERRYASVRDALRQLEISVNRPPLIRLTRTRKRLLGAVVLLFGLTAVVTWRYLQSDYTPAGEALRLYRLAVHSQQLGLPWKASQLFERALQADPRFIAARAHLAEAWMDLDQPGRAKAELQRTAELRPRWRRPAAHQLLLEQAVNAQLRGDLMESARLHERATAAATESEKLDVSFSEARAKARAGDVPAAIAGFGSIADRAPCRGTAILAHAVLLYSKHPARGRSRFHEAVNCFQAAGDLDGVAQTWYEFARADDAFHGFDRVRRAAAVAQTSGNIEQQIAAAAFLSELMLEMMDDEAASTNFAEAMQLADGNGLPFISARLLDERAEYLFRKGEFLQSAHFTDLATSLSGSAIMPWTEARCYIRGAKLLIRMGNPVMALNRLSEARERLIQFPNAALSVELSQLTEQARQTRSRPEESIYQAPARNQPVK